jgi:hypothetical protein
MKRLLRPGLLVLVSIGVLGAAALVFWPLVAGTPASRAVPRLVPTGDQEIAWLDPATNTVGWERFVAAVHRLQARDTLGGLHELSVGDPFPPHTADVPELAVRYGSTQQRIWFRWYKLTGDLGPAQWVEALSRRNPPPLAIIGGGSSDRARDLARALQTVAPALASPPLLVLTTATADQVGQGENLMQLYPERTFRFCFTNRQMAEAVSDFLWSQEPLRPDTEPMYLVRWEDDPYSEDLFDQFHEVLGPEGYARSLERGRAARAVARDWAWLAGRAASGGVPPGLDLEGLRSDGVPAPGPFWSMPIPYSVGAFSRPNSWDAEVAEALITEVEQHPAQRRPLLVLPANPQPARRFLRALVRTAPRRASQFVVATGDGINFNTIFRDRNLAWHIQDLPMALVLFCHRNPVDPSAFQPDQASPTDQAPDPFGRTSTSTQDLLLYEDIVASLMEAAVDNEQLRTRADDVATALRQARLPDGRQRFTEAGNQVSGAGEYVVSLRPVHRGDHVLPQARMQVWNRSADPQGRNWTQVRVAGELELSVHYIPEPGSLAHAVGE